MNKLTVSILIATKNGEAAVRRLIESLALDVVIKSGASEIIVLDDGSVPPISRLPVGKQLRNEQSTGVGAGRNRLANAASGRYYLFLDDDAQLEGSTTLTRALNVIKSYNDKCMVAFSELDPEGNFFWLQPTIATVQSWIARFCGFAFLIPSEMWNKCGGFSEILFYQYEEADLSYRILNNGYRIFFDPALGIKHYRKLEPSQRARIHGWLLRNMMFTTVLRFPFALVPFNIIRSVFQYNRFAAGDGFFVKMRKIAWSSWQLVNHFPPLIRQRKALPLRSLLLFRSLQRNPEAIMIK